MQDKQARARSGLGRIRKESGSKPDARVSVSLEHLRKLEGPAAQLHFLPRQAAHSVLNGRHSSRLRGRGLNFEELRDYLPSDDVRTIDWKVTARTGSPHVRVYTEERDRPALIVVDQRMSMFFGSALNMKSVTAAECAALAAFAILEQGDRVGGIVVGDESIAEIRPKRSRAALNAFLSALANANSLLRADAPNTEPVSFNQVLTSVARIARHNHLIFILSDFDSVDENTHRLLAGISKRNDVILGLVSDPYAKELPEKLRIVVSDGELQAEIDTGKEHTRRRLAEMAEGRLANILQWQQQLGIPVLPLSSAEDSLSQLRQLLGLPRRRV